MNIFKITGPERGKTIIIPANDQEDLIYTACTRLNLPLDQTYQIVLENDGSLIEEFEVMCAIASRADLIKFMLLPDGTTWTSPNSASGDSGQSSVGGNSTTNSTPNLNATQDNFDFTSQFATENQEFAVPIVWGEIIPKGFQNSSKNSNMMMRKLIHRTSDYMMTTLKSTSYPDTLKIARQIVSKYPKAFEKVTWKDGRVYSDGTHELRTIIYDRLKYEQKKLAQKRGHVETEDGDASISNTNEKEKAKIPRYAKSQEYYGCVAYEPPLPDNETVESHQEKKNLLLQYFEEDCDTMVVTDLLKQTYPSQRISLNRRDLNKVTLKEILSNHWPYLTKEKYFIDHADILFGKKVQEEWNLNLEERSKYIVSYFEGMIFQSRKKKNSSEIVTKSDQLREILRVCKEKEKEMQSRKPSAIVLFPLIACQFKEEQLITLKDTVVTEEEIKNAASDTEKNSKLPALIVTGSSIYDKSCRCYILIDKEIVLRSNCLLKSVLLLYLTYYVYSYNYPSKKTASFQFIERVLLDIIPVKGQKGMKISKKVGSLVENIKNFSDDWKM